MNWNPFRSLMRSDRDTTFEQARPRRKKQGHLCRACRVEQLEERMLLVVGATAIPDPVPAGNGFDGVVQVLYANWSCTGSLLDSGRHVLTAAHCLTDETGEPLGADATVIFTLPGSVPFRLPPVPPAMQHIHEEWNGAVTNKADVAILELPVLAPSDADRYPIYRASDEIDQPFWFVGYGMAGTGATGQTQYDGLKRLGFNEFGATSTSSFDAGAVLVSDFDDGTQDYNTLRDSLGLGPIEATVADGDSGGPAFIGGAIAGIASFPPLVDRLVGGVNDFGDRAIFTRVSRYASWIDAKMSETHDLVFSMFLEPTANDGAPDTVVARQVAGNVELIVNGAAIYSVPSGQVRSLIIEGSDDDDTITVDASLNIPVTLFGQDGNDRLTGSASNDTLDGGHGNDTIVAGAGQDQVIGGPGDDSLEGGNNFDTLLGGDGNDTLIGGSGDDRLDGMDGNDSLQGDDGYDVLTGGVGNDTLAGGLLSDRYVFEPASQLAADEVDVVLELAEQGLDRLDFSTLGIDEPVVVDLANPDLLAQHGHRIVRTDVGMSSYLENLTGGSGNDRIAGNENANNLRGQGGSDTLIGSVGQDTLEGQSGNDILDGGDNFDTLWGGDGNDTLIGGSGDDRLDGMDGNDSVQGDDGYDVLTGGVGNDTLAGGPLSDRYVFEPASQLADDEVDTVLEFAEQGLDRLDFSTLGIDEPVVVDLANPDLLAQHGRRIVRTDVGMSSYLENLTGGSGNDRIAGNENANNLRGQGGSDTLIGSVGQDTLEGESGNDMLDGGDNYDTLWGGDGDDTLYGGSGNDQLRGDVGNDALYGGSGADYLAGGDGDDILDGGRDGDRDTLSGGLGADRFVDNVVMELTWYTYYRQSTRWDPILRRYVTTWIPVRSSYYRPVSEDSIDDYFSSEGDTISVVYL